MFLAELTPVSSVSVDYTCTTNSAMVHWSEVFGAQSYEAHAMGDNGTQLMCTSQGTRCQISGLHCGQSYEVHVTPISESCKHMLNTTWTTFQTGEIHVSLYQITQSPESILIKFIQWRSCDPLMTTQDHYCSPLFIWELMVFSPRPQHKIMK